MPVPTSLLVMTEPPKEAKPSEQSYKLVPTEEPAHKAEGPPPGAVQGPVPGAFRLGDTGNDQTVAGDAIKAAYEASRTGDPDAFADAFEGAVTSLIAREIKAALKGK